MAKIRPPKHNVAVGLRFDSSRNEAPAVSVKGEKFDAEQIVRLAQRFGVPVIKRKELARALMALKVDQSIPADLFEAVAIVIARLERDIR